MSDDTLTAEPATDPAATTDGPATDAATPEPAAAADAGEPTSEVAPPAFADLGDGVPDGAARDAGLLAGIEVELSVELGRSRIPMRKLLSLTPGAVVDLDTSPGMAVDILANGTTIARGEVVVVDGDFGVRVTEIVRRGA